MLRKISREGKKNSVILLKLLKLLEIQQFFQHMVEEIVAQTGSGLVQ